MGRKKTEHVSRAYNYLMTVTRDVATCTDIVYGNISELIFLRLGPFPLKIISWVPIPERALLENGTYNYTIVILTSPLNSVLQCGTNISITEICAKWSVFSSMVAYIITVLPQYSVHTLFLRILRAAFRPIAKDTAIDPVATHEANWSVKRVLEKLEGLLEGKGEQSDSGPF